MINRLRAKMCSSIANSQHNAINEYKKTILQSFDFEKTFTFYFIASSFYNFLGNELYQFQRKENKTCFEIKSYCYFIWANACIRFNHVL